VPAPKGSGLSKSAASRRFVALSAARLKEWIARDCLGLLVIQIDGIHMDEDMTLVAAIGVALRANDDETKTCREFTLEGIGQTSSGYAPHQRQQDACSSRR
jgi:hypothetical protein